MSTATAEVKPKRIQRKRTRGWTTPPNTVYVGRPTIFGNPFVVDAEHDAAWAFVCIGLGWKGRREREAACGERRCLRVYTNCAATVTRFVRRKRKHS